MANHNGGGKDSHDRPNGTEGDGPYNVVALPGNQAARKFQRNWTSVVSFLLGMIMVTAVAYVDGPTRWVVGALGLLAMAFIPLRVEYARKKYTSSRWNAVIQPARAWTAAIGSLFVFVLLYQQLDLESMLDNLNGPFLGLTTVTLLATCILMITASGDDDRNGGR